MCYVIGSELLVTHPQIMPVVLNMDCSHVYDVKTFSTLIGSRYLP